MSGLGFLFPSFNWLMQIMGTPQLARILHPFVGVVMFASFIIMFFRYWHHNLINRDDIFWAKNIRKIVVNEEVGFAPAFSIPVIRFALMLHSFAAVALIVVIMVHIYAALWVKGTITAMVEGWVTSAWAKKHHPRWYREVRKTTEKKAE